MRRRDDLLERLLSEERARSADLLEKLIYALSVAPPGTDVRRASAPPDPAWNWPELQPEDEAREDVSSMVKSGQITEVEAAAVLESLGFPGAEVITDP